MRYTFSPSSNSKWFYRLDFDANPAQLMLYQFVGAKFEAHRLSLNDTTEIINLLEKIYAIEPVREALLSIIFCASYPDADFEQILKKMCSLRDEFI